MLQQYLKTIGCCLILLALSVAGLTDAHASTIVIDPFDVPQGPEPTGGGVNDPSILGGNRFLEQAGEVVGLVGDGVLVAFNSTNPGGMVQTVYAGGNTLGGVDLTDNGSNAFFELDIAFFSLGSLIDTITIEVQDSSGFTGSEERFWDGLGLGSNLIPFSTFGSTDFTSVDLIRLRIGLVEQNRFIGIDSFSAVSGVPEPSTALLVGSALGVLGWARRRTSR